MKKLTIEQVKRRIFEIHGNIIVLDETTYKSTHKKCRFVDKDFGEWYVAPHSVLRGYSNKQRGKLKRIQTSIQRYGVENVFQDQNVKVKIKQTNVKVYGTENCNQNKQIKEKSRQTCIKKYGVDCPAQNQKIKEKTKQTNIQKYGFGCSLQNTAVKEKRTKTFLKKYGVIHPQQNKEIALKTAKSSNDSFVLFHWKTNEELICRGSYEKKAVEYLNKNQIDFNFQIPFDIPNGKRYFIDLYLKEQDLWVEIKGYFRKDALEKWSWFHDKYPNSELWNEAKLKEMKIL